MKLSQDIAAIFSEESAKTINFGDFLQKINHKSFGVTLAILALPSALPLPAPGYSTPFGILLAFLGLQIITNRKFIWFPEFVTNKSLPTGGDSKFINGMVSFLSFFERFLKPRVKILSKGLFYRLVGALVFLCACSMILPIPLTNTAPAFGIFLLALGLLEEDGLFIILGIIASILGLMLTSLVLYMIYRFGDAGIDMIRNWISNLRS